MPYFRVALQCKELDKLLCNYDNFDLRNAYVEFTTAASVIYRSQNGKSIAEQWSENMGIPTYTTDKEIGIIRNNQTGAITKLKKKSHIKIVK